MAVGAHPDDIEFMMAGTLLLFARRGAEIHMWSIANGCCGSDVLSREEIASLRWEEALRSAMEAGAILHEPIAEDMSITYDLNLLARVSAVIRSVKPDILLIPSPFDYMEDHTNTARLVVSAAFSRGMPNFSTEPAVEPFNKWVYIYHAMPYGLTDPLRRVVFPGMFVDIGPVFKKKVSMLSKHVSQRDWLERSQGKGAYTSFVEEMCRTLGKMSKRFEFAEGWTMRSHLGFSPSEKNIMKELLGDLCLVNEDFENWLGWDCGNHA